MDLVTDAGVLRQAELVDSATKAAKKEHAMVVLKRFCGLGGWRDNGKSLSYWN